jgi:hypothetical protein
MAELKTKPTQISVQAFIEGLEAEEKRADCLALLALMQEITGQAPKMWGESMVGFGDYHYKYATGREGDWFVMGFSPRKQNLTLYIMGSQWESYSEGLSKLGKHSLGKSCLYIKRLKDIDLSTLKDLLTQAFQGAQAKD